LTPPAVNNKAVVAALPAADLRSPAAAESDRGSVLRSTALFGSISVAAYLFSFVKTLAVTHLFGTSAAMDSFTIAVLVPNLLGALVAGSAAAGLVPNLAVAERQGMAARANAYRGCLLAITIASAAVAAALALGAAPILRVVGFGLDRARSEAAVPLLRLASPMLIFQALYAFASAELLSRTRYVITAAAPAISTVVSLVVILAFYHAGIVVLVYGLVIGTALQAAVVLGPSLEANPLAGRLSLLSPFLHDILRDQLPLLLVSSFGVVNVFVDQTIASLLPVGSVSALNYANTLNAIVVQAVIMSAGWVALPQFSSLYASGDTAALLQMGRRCIRGVVMVSAPVTALILVAGMPAIRFAFQHGAFDAHSTRLVYATWAGYALGLVPFSITMIAVRMGNAMRAQKQLAKIGLLSVPINAALDYALMRVFGCFGISLSTSLVYCVSGVLMFVVVARTVGNLLDAETGRAVLRMVAAAGLAGCVFLLLLYSRSGPVIVISSVLYLAAVILAYSAFGISSHALSEEIGLIRGWLRRKFGHSGA
jgi:putative peptidoglycan lipid II flippase